jgi:hypothetical protein
MYFKNLDFYLEYFQYFDIEKYIIIYNSKQKIAFNILKILFRHVEN